MELAVRFARIPCIFPVKQGLDAETSLQTAYSASIFTYDLLVETALLGRPSKTIQVEPNGRFVLIAQRILAVSGVPVRTKARPIQTREWR